MDEDQAPAPGAPDDATPHLRADVLVVPVVVPEAADVIIVPGTGEVVAIDDEDALIRALHAVRDFEEHVKTAKGDLTDAIVARSVLLGSKTITLHDGRKGVVSGDTETSYDAEAIETELREAGMPEDRIRQIVREEVTYVVVAAEAKKAAGANPVYAEIIARNRHTRPKTPYVSLKGFRV